eukprot:IDg7236t1
MRALAAVRVIHTEYENHARTTPSRRAQGRRRAAKDSTERSYREKQRVDHLGTISESLKRKSDAIKEANALFVFRMGMSDHTEEDVRHRDMFVRPLRMNYAAPARISTAGDSVHLDQADSPVD